LTSSFLYIPWPGRRREKALKAIRERTEAITPDVQQYPVTTTRKERISIACEITYLAQEEGIIQVFRKLRQWAARELRPLRVNAISP
jgi:hypothetical protein